MVIDADTAPYCARCGNRMRPYYHAEIGMQLRGWLCSICLHSIRAIGRERQIIKGDEIAGD